MRYVLSGVAAVAALGISAPVALAASSPSSPASASAASAKALLISAARTESAAYQQYFAYAAAADRGGKTALAGVWQTVGEVEHQDHWTHEITQYGLYSGSDNISNLELAITQAKQAATADARWALQAPKGSAAASELRTVAARETAAAALLKKALNGSVPAAPAVKQVKVTVSAKPYFSGTFYNDLTSGSNSALELAAWNWAEYQFLAKTAVDTGQANLAQLLSGLEAQEVQSWTELSNVAGYVNSDAMNLAASIASEQGAVNMYTQYAAEATQMGNPAIAATFLAIRGDEHGHRNTFSAELKQVTG